ncbi:MAG: biotin--[acetyl-CoA-carboxylase] ligase [Prevotellaceae bacterium]|jgi:BirA family biotin operon repressor/biotin-[acetyl-CoA-carboxylase] ligase|nr:biotin--[acetyl-CoA-carboxylase] ligase [Prevotellaceae bacterium]
MDVLFFDQLGSTNDKAMELLAQGCPEGLTVAALHQTNGRGQQNACWESEKGLNLTFSIALRPTFLPAESMFYLSKIVSLGIAAQLRREGINAAIKWPNDIYVNDEKICGILIEQSICGDRIAQSAVGVGLNVNQRQFAHASNATSMLLCDGKTRDVKRSLKALASAILKHYEALKCAKSKNDFAKIDGEYASLLYRSSGFFPYRSGSEVFAARITAVSPSGELTLQTSDGKQRTFGFKEVEFIR